MQRLPCRAQQRGILVEHHRHRNIAHQFLEFLLAVAKVLQERSVLDLLQYLRRDPSGHVYPAKRQHLQRQIPRFRSVNRRPQVQRGHAHCAVFFEAPPGNFRRGRVAGFIERIMPHGRVQKLVQRAEAAPGKDQFPGDMRGPLAHEAQQFNLLLGVRREVAVSSLAGRHAIARAVPHQQRLPMPRSRRQQRPRPSRLRNPLVENVQFVAAQMLQAVPGGLQIVQPFHSSGRRAAMGGGMLRRH